MLLTFILMSIAGTLFGTIAVAGMNGKIWKKAVVFILVSCGIGAILTGGFALDVKQNDFIWNNGYCNCGGEWDFVNGSTYRNSTHYFYQCEDCEKIIELSQKRG